MFEISRSNTNPNIARNGKTISAQTKYRAILQTIGGFLKRSADCLKSTARFASWQVIGFYLWTARSLEQLIGSDYDADIFHNLLAGDR
jgi:hypothetical protein